MTGGRAEAAGSPAGTASAAGSARTRAAAAPFREHAAQLVAGGGAWSVPGVRVGSAQRSTGGWLTGATAIVAPPGAVAGVDVRGGGPATHETDVIAPGTHSPGVDAILLTGGSAWGLAAAGGVQRGLASEGRGFPAPGLPGAFVPIVPAAAVYDLGRGDGTVRHPDAGMGLAAYRAAVRTADAGTDTGTSRDPVVPERGSVGAGTGAFIGRGLLRGGLGSVCLRTAAGHLVAAIVTANPMGDVLEPSGRLHAAGVLAHMGHELPLAPADWVDRALAVDGTALGDPSFRNTTIAVIVTDAPLDSAQATRLAQSAHAGISRAVHPSHTLADGDTVFALATGGAGSVDPTALFMLNAAAAGALSLAIVDAALTAAPHSPAPGGAPSLPRPAALSQIAPEQASAWEMLRSAGG